MEKSAKMQFFNMHLMGEDYDTAYHKEILARAVCSAMTACTG